MAKAAGGPSACAAAAEPQGPGTGRLVAVVVTHNRLDKLKVTLARLLESPEHELAAVVVADNASTDGTGAWLAAQDDPRLDICTSAVNRGGAGGFETGMRRAMQAHGPAWLVVMDDDGRPAPGGLAAFHALPAGKWNAVAAAVYFPDGRICEMNRPSRNPFWHAREFLRTLFGGGRSGFHVQPSDYEGQGMQIDVTSFVGFFISAQALQRAGYGFDLSPLSARVEEFEQLHIELQAERELCHRLKRQITVARRMIRARIEAAFSGALRGPWEHLSGLFDDLLERLPRRNTGSETLSRLLAWFGELQERVEAAYLKAVRADEVVENTAETTEQISEKTQEMDPREVITEPHILITTQLNPVTCNRSETEQAASVVPNAPPEEEVDRELEDWVAETRKKRGAALDLLTMMQACPEFASWARNMGGFLKDWAICTGLLDN